MKDIIFNILKYILFVLLLVFLLGYLSINEKLPALFSDDLASQMKEISVVVWNTISGNKKIETEKSVEPVYYKKQSIGYEILDFLLLNNRYHIIKQQGQLHSEKAKQWLEDYKSILSSLQSSSEYVNFVRQPKSEVTRYELKSFIDKLLEEEKDLIGVDIYTENMTRLLKLEKETMFPLQRTDILNNDLTLLVKQFENKSQFNIVLNAGSTYLRFVYSPKIFNFLSTTDEFKNFFLVLDNRNKLTYSSSDKFPPYTLDELRTEILKKKMPFSIQFNGQNYKIFYNNLFNDFTTIYLYQRVPLIQIILNVFMYLLILFLLFVILFLIQYIYKQIYLKIKQKRIDKEELMTGMMSEMANTLKTTAELTEKVMEDSKENIELVNKTIEKANSLSEEEISSGSNEWKILED